MKTWGPQIVESTNIIIFNLVPIKLDYQNYSDGDSNDVFL